MADGPRYVDVNIFVYWLGSHPKFTEPAKKWISRMEESSRGDYVTSAITLYETLVILGDLTGKNFKDKSLIANTIHPISHIKGLTIEPLKPEDFAKAVDIMSEWKLDYEDSLHLAVALRVGAQEIVSNDKDFDLAPIKRAM